MSIMRKYYGDKEGPEIQSAQAVTDYCITGKPPEGVRATVMNALANIVVHEGWKQ